MKSGSTVIESYLYDADGVRIKKSGSAAVTKYYYFNGAQGAPRTAMNKGEVLTYLHGVRGHLGVAAPYSKSTQAAQ